MYRTFKAAAGAALLFLLVCSGGGLVAKTQPSELALLKAKLRLRTPGRDASPRDSVRLVMSVKGRALPRSWDPTRDETVVTIGGRVVISLPSSDEHAVTRFKNDRWVYREKRSPDRESRRKLIVDFRRGRITLKVKGLDLSSLDVSHLDLQVKLNGKAWELTVPVLRKGSCWISSGKAMRFELPGGTPDPDPDPDPGPGPGPFPDPDPDPDPDPKPAITWQEMVWGHDWNNAVADQVIADTQAEFDALWSRARGSLSKPTVDFSKEMVVGIFLGKVLNAKVVIVSVKREGNDIRVSYRAVADTNRYFAPPPPYPHYLFTMTKTSERILFTRLP